jgi:hypothetical protein
VDTSGDVGLYSALAFAADGTPQACYFDATRRDLRFAVRSGSEWVITTVDSTGDVGRHCAIAMDPQNRPHLAYYDATSADLRYAFWNGSSWELQTVDSGGDVGRYCSIAVDSDGQPWISYQGGSPPQLRVATRTFGSWSWQVVDAQPSTGYYTSIAARLGTVHVSYRDQGNGDLVHVAGHPSSGWQRETVDAEGDTGYYTSLRLDEQGLPRIAYFDATGQDLEYAAFDGAEWALQTVESAGSTGRYCSLSLGSGGEPEISYQRSVMGEGELMVASRAGGTWASVLVDAVGDAGRGTTAAHSPLDLELLVLAYRATEGDLMAFQDVPAVSDCQLTYLWAAGSAISSAGLDFWPSHAQLAEMRPGDVIALRSPAVDSDWLVQTCTDCLGRTRTEKFGPYPDRLSFHWQLAAGNRGQLLNASGTSANMVLYRLPLCLDSNPPFTETVTISHTIENDPAGGKAPDATLIGPTIQLTLEWCGPSPYYIKVTLTQVPGGTNPDQPVATGGTGNCVPQPPQWFPAFAIVSDTVQVIEAAETCPDYLAILSVPSHDFDQALLTCDAPPGCTDPSLVITTGDVTRATWSLIGSNGDFPLGVQGQSVAFQRSRVGPGFVEALTDDTGPQGNDAPRLTGTLMQRAKRPMAFVGVGDTEGLRALGLDQVDGINAALIARQKYADAGYVVDYHSAYTAAGLRSALADRRFQAVWLTGHGAGGFLRTTDPTPPGGEPLSVGPIDFGNAGRAFGCLREHPYVREVVFLGCFTDHPSWAHTTVCQRYLGFKDKVWSDIIGLGESRLFGLNVELWERDQHKPLKAHDLSEE